jgi:hypothetical protein
MADSSKPGISDVGHNPKIEKNVPLNTGFGQDGFANNRGWVIDFYHVASGKCVNFKSFLTSFSDSFSSNWTEEQVYGRMDPIAMFQGTTRKISFGFSVPAESEDDARKNMHKFEHLSTMLYPTYRESDGVNTMQGTPLLKIKFTNLISNSVKAPSSPSAYENGLLGFLDGISMNPDTESGWFAPKPGLLYPKAFDLECNFTVLHTHDLGFKDGSLTGRWLGESDDVYFEGHNEASGYPYGLHKITGTHSMCPGGGMITYGGGNSKNGDVKKAQENKVLK